VFVAKATSAVVQTEKPVTQTPCVERAFVLPMESVGCLADKPAPTLPRVAHKIAKTRFARTRLMRELEMMQASMWTVGLPMAEVQATMAVPVVATLETQEMWELVAARVLREMQAVTLAVRQATTNCVLAVVGSLASSDNQVRL